MMMMECLENLEAIGGAGNEKEKKKKKIHEPWMEEWMDGILIAIYCNVHEKWNIVHTCKYTVYECVCVWIFCFSNQNTFSLESWIYKKNKTNKWKKQLALTNKQTISNIVIVADHHHGKDRRHHFVVVFIINQISKHWKKPKQKLKWNETKINAGGVFPFSIHFWLDYSTM